METMINLLLPRNPDKVNQVKSLALSLGANLIDPADAADGFYLDLTDQGLELLQKPASLGNPLRISFTDGKVAHRKKFGGGKGQDIAKAVGLNKSSSIRVLDATAGLGRDAYVLASLGCEVIMTERNPVVFVLLQDALDRGMQDPETAEVLQRMSLRNTDALMLSGQESTGVQVVYLDPMFPGREKSASVKKELRYLQEVVGYDQSDDALLPWALKLAENRVVVKRPKNAPFLNDQKPDLQFTGKSGRFDVYTLKAF